MVQLVGPAVAVSNVSGVVVKSLESERFLFLTSQHIDNQDVYQFSLTAVVLATACFVSLLLVIAVSRISADRIGLALVVWASGTAVWSGTSALRLAATTEFHELVWYSVRFVGVTVAGTGFFLIAAAYTVRMQWFEARNLAVLLFVPVITNLLAWTNTVHNLMWTVGGQEGLLVANPDPGPWFLVHVVWAYLLVIAGSYWLVASIIRNRRSLYRGQAGLILLAVVLGIAPNVLLLAGVTTVDWTPIGNAAAAVTLAVAVFQYKIFDISPIARDVVVENIDSAMVVTDDEYRIVDANERATPILGEDSDELLGESLGEVVGIPPEDFDGKTDGGTADPVRLTVDGREEFYEVTDSGIYDVTGSEVGRVLLFSDVTAEVNRQRQLEEQNRELERKNERLDKFASIISHDLRNPLGVAQLRLGLVEQETEHTEAIDDALDRMETMIHDILTMARADTIVEETESISLRSLSRTAWKTVETEQATLELDIPENATVEGDWSLLRNTFENLFRNAIEHNDPPVTIRVGTKQDSADSVECFFIEDDGTGIPEDQRAQVFEFGHTTSDQGTGFGLAIVDELLDAHGWEVVVTDGELGGARFEVDTSDS